MTSLNPCTEKGHHKRALYGVRGKVTELCVYCVVLRAKEMGMEKALDTFNPDPDGATLST